MKIDLTAIIIAAFWPIIFFTLCLVYRRSIIKLMSRLMSIDANPRGMQIALQQQEEKLTQISDKLDSLTPQGQKYTDFRTSLPAAERIIVDYVENQLRSGLKTTNVDIKLKAIALTYSWNYFVVACIPALLERYPTLTINLQILMVDHSHLEKLYLQNNQVTWAENSRRREKDIQRFCKNAAEYRGRLSVTAKSYHNLPYWHGVLINNNQLFLGRTNWNFPCGQPELIGGRNVYRYYDSHNEEGAARVELFSNWFRFFFNHASESIAVSAHSMLNLHPPETEGPETVEI